MSGHDRYVTVFSLFSVLWESQDSQGVGVKVAGDWSCALVTHCHQWDS